MRYGVLMARKAWLTRGIVLNTLSAEEVDGFFNAVKKKASR
jgi:hypothetical protein